MNFFDKSNGCDGSFGGRRQHVCVVPPAGLEVVSKGFKHGNLASIQVGGNMAVTRGSRGMNVVVVDENTGKVLATKSYDTSAFRKDAAKMKQDMKALPEGRL